jgi:Flp pilus assembly protein CpaB
VTTLTAPAVRRRIVRLPRLDARLGAGLALVALSVLGGLRLVAAADHTTAVIVAARDLAANHVIERGDLRTAKVHASPAVIGGLVRSDRIGALTGQVLLFPVRANGLLGASAVGKAARDGREMTVPVAPEHALGGALRVGDRVDVLASFAKAGKDARTLTVVRGATVVDTVHTEGLFGQREGQLTALTLSVPPDDAVYLAFALRNGEVDVVRSTGTNGAARSRFDVSQLP